MAKKVNKKEVVDLIKVSYNVDKILDDIKKGQFEFDYLISDMVGAKMSEDDNALLSEAIQSISDICTKYMLQSFTEIASNVKGKE